jgi:hypothetical protein
MITKHKIANLVKVCAVLVLVTMFFLAMVGGVQFKAKHMTLLLSGVFLTPAVLGILEDEVLIKTGAIRKCDAPFRYWFFVTFYMLAAIWVFVVYVMAM